MDNIIKQISDRKSSEMASRSEHPGHMQRMECAVPPGLGEKAPEFTAVTTDGVKNLSDYCGKWLIMFSHPGDFTPVLSVS